MSEISCGRAEGGQKALCPSTKVLLSDAFEDFVCMPLYRYLCTTDSADLIAAMFLFPCCTGNVGRHSAGEGIRSSKNLLNIQASWGAGNHRSR